MSVRQVPREGRVDRQQQILDAVLSLLSDKGIAGVSMRGVARRAGVAVGLVNYYYSDKHGLIAASLRRIGEQDVALVEPDPDLPPTEQLRAVLRRVAEPALLTTEYLSLRMQLWALAQADADYAEINAGAQRAYRDGIAELIRAARPELPRAEADRRAADIDVIQNGIWLTALLGLDAASIHRSLARCERIALRD